MEEILSIAVIARNEEPLVERMFKSIRDNLGNVEVVFVDTGSTDRTVELAKANGATVHEVGEKFAKYLDVNDALFINSMSKLNLVRPGDRCFLFDSARNQANDLCTKDWILALDVAQIIEKIDKEKLIELLKTTKIETFNCFLTLGNTRFSTTRIFKRATGEWGEPAHEIYYQKSGKKEHTDLIELRHIRKENDKKNYLPVLAYAYYLAPKKQVGSEPRRKFYFARELYYAGWLRQDVRSAAFETRY